MYIWWRHIHWKRVLAQFLSNIRVQLYGLLGSDKTSLVTPGTYSAPTVKSSVSKVVVVSLIYYFAFLKNFKFDSPLFVVSMIQQHHSTKRHYHANVKRSCNAKQLHLNSLPTIGNIRARVWAFTLPAGAWRAHTRAPRQMFYKMSYEPISKYHQICY
jgi:hypothetical protein